MGISPNLGDQISHIIPEIENLIVKTSIFPQQEFTSKSEYAQINNVSNNTETFDSSDYIVSFSGEQRSYCIGTADIVGSTKVAAKLNGNQWCQYYGIFLNSMSKILKRFGGIAIKNNGDSLLYYFPESVHSKRLYGFLSCIECSLAMIEMHDCINKRLHKDNLPQLDYRVSADYGNCSIMQSNYSSAIDVIGPSVNMCCKINRAAEKNGVVIGGDLFQMFNDVDDYCVKPVTGYSLGFKYSYPVYSVHRKAE